MAGVSLLYLTIAWAKSIHFFATNRSVYQIHFEDVTGLRIGDPVFVYGIESGNVSAIEFDRDGAKVRVSVDEKVVLNSDATSEIRMKEMMGGKQVDINPGSSQQEIGKDAVIPGKLAMDFSSGFATMGNWMQGWNKEKIDSLIVNLNEVASAFAELGKSLKEDEVAEMIRSLSASARTMENMLNEAQGKLLVSRLDDALKQSEVMIGEAGKAIATIDRISNSVESRTMPIADSLMTQGNEAFAKMEFVLAESLALLEVMKNKKSTVGKLLYDEKFSQEIGLAIDNLNKTMEHVRNKKLHVAMSLTHKQKKEFSGEMEKK